MAQTFFNVATKPQVFHFLTSLRAIPKNQTRRQPKGAKDYNSKEKFIDLLANHSLNISYASNYFKINAGSTEVL